jgi:hypothetical protein
VNDKIVSMDQFRVLKKQEDDQDDQQWKDYVCELLDQVKERVQSGETSALMMLELKDEVGKWHQHILGFGEMDHFTVAGILESVKLTVIDSLYDE